MAIVKRINGFVIHSKQLKRDWVNKELKITYLYYCLFRLNTKKVFESESLEEVIKFCESQKV